MATLSEIQMNSEQYQRYSNVQADPFAGAVTLLRVNPQVALEHPGSFSFTMPGVSGTVQAQSSHTETYQDGYFWGGGMTNRGGHVCILQKGGAYAGVLMADSVQFELIPIKVGYSMLVRKNEGYDLGTCISGGENPSGGVGQGPSCNINDCPAIVSVLVLVTQDGFDYLMSTYGMYGTAFYFGIIAPVQNTILMNSGITNQSVRVKVVFPFEMDLSIDKPNEDAIAFATLAQQLKSDNKADLAILLAHHTWTFVNNGVPVQVLGVVNKINDLGNDKDAAFGIVSIDHMFFTFNHELGHLFGARHNEEWNCGNESESPDYNFGYLFAGNSSNGYRTIMGVFDPTICLAASLRTIMHYSNPDITFDGQATGVFNYIDNDGVKQKTCNATRISDNFCSVFNNIETAELDISITGALTCQTVLSANIILPSPIPSDFVGLPPYYYTWSWNATGVFNNFSSGQFLGNTPTIALSLPLACPDYYIRLTVVSNDGVAVTRIKKFSIPNCSSCLGTGNKVSKINEVEATPQIFLSPNPASETCTITLTNRLQDFQGIEVVKISGQKFKVNYIKVSEFAYSFDVANLPEGFYFINILANNRVYSQKMIKNKN